MLVQSCKIKPNICILSTYHIINIRPNIFMILSNIDNQLK